MKQEVSGSGARYTARGMELWGKGAGATLTLQMKRYANQPTLDFPWGGPAVDQGTEVRSGLAAY